MVSSILHRATGIALAIGTVLVVWGILALASGEAAFVQFRTCIGSPLGLILLLGWSWALSYHLCNGIRHLVQDTGAGYAIPQFVRSSWLSVIGSVVLTVVIWAFVLIGGAA
ncbi:succinate dehydrogenase membrane anchor subunit [Rhodanobacter thiooxydans LCS2]|nr:succinate dehydrogenase membrane anchor subunit [Rhodanobacter thiooxydans LCS2]